jgi:hypothetical protein
MGRPYPGRTGRRHPGGVMRRRAAGAHGRPVPSTDRRGTGRSRRAAVAARLGAADAAGLLYGAVVTAAVLAVVSAHATGVGSVLASVVLVLGAYWLAHVYTRALSERLAHPNRGLGARIREAAVEEVAVLQGGLPALAAFVVATVLGAGPAAAGTLALWVSVALLAAVGYLAGHAAGVTGWGLVAETLTAALFGVLIVVLKAAMH